MNNMEAMMKITQGWNRFRQNHPKFPAFLNAVKTKGIKEGTIIAVSITDPEGNVTDTNIRVTADDLELFNSLKDMR